MAKSGFEPSYSPAQPTVSQWRYTTRATGVGIQSTFQLILIALKNSGMKLVDFDTEVYDVVRIQAVFEGTEDQWRIHSSFLGVPAK